MTSKLRFALLWGLLTTSVFSQEIPTPQQLIETSRQASDLAQIGPYQLQATVVLTLGSSKQSGKITVLRDGGRYRSELQLAQYREVRWINGSKLFVGRSNPVPVPKTTLLRRVDRLWMADLLPPGARVSKVHKRKHNHELAECFDVNLPDAPSRQFCFDSQSLLVNKNYEMHELEFRDPGTFEQKHFPRRIIFREQDQIVLELQDITITKARFDADAFVPPQAAPAFDTCDDPVAPRRIKDVIPRIPTAELRQLRSAKVYLYGLIGTDGTVQNLAVQYSPLAAFTDSALDAVKQWRFTPAMCGDKPVPMETELYFAYYTP